MDTLHLFHQYFIQIQCDTADDQYPVRCQIFGFKKEIQQEKEQTEYDDHNITLEHQLDISVHDLVKNIVKLLFLQSTVQKQIFIQNSFFLHSTSLL